MTNEQIVEKMKEDMEMRNFSSYTNDFYLRKTKDVMKYFKSTKGKDLEEATTDELREYLLKYLKMKKVSRYKCK